MKNCFLCCGTKLDEDRFKTNERAVRDDVRMVKGIPFKLPLPPMNPSCTKQRK